jgi:hypothetical protein
VINIDLNYQPTIILSSGKRIFLPVISLPRTNARVNGPILPININKLTITFPMTDKSALNPVLRPTVPNAENASKITA